MRSCLRFPALLFAAIAISSLGLAVPADAQQTGPALSWTIQESGTTAGLRGIYSLDGQVAWASGTEGTVLRTTDGGWHWSRCTTPDAATDGATLDFRGIQAFDAATAIAMSSGPGDKSRIYKTTDACKSWTLVLTNPDKDGFWDAIRARLSEDHKSIDATIAGDPVQGSFTLFNLKISLGTKEAHVVALPSDLCKLQVSLQLPLPIDPCLRSIFVQQAQAEAPHAEGGTARSEQGLVELLKAYANPVPLKAEALFAASNSSIANHPDTWFSPDIAFVTGGPGGARFLHYRGWPCAGLGCISWRVTKVPLAASDSAGAFSIAVRADRKGSWHGVIVGGDYQKPDSSISSSAYSNDEGKTWKSSLTPPHGFRSTVQYSPDLKAWITAGTNGSDISHDDGKTWQPIDDGNWNALSLPFLVGPKGRIARLSVAPAAH